jgi:hypothetical protein
MNGRKNGDGGIQSDTNDDDAEDRVRDDMIYRKQKVNEPGKEKENCSV